MSTVRSIISTNVRAVVTIRSGDSVLEAARVMNQHHIGSVVVLRAVGGDVVGILTERDVLTRVVAIARDPRTTAVADVMTSPVYFCTPDTPLVELREVMMTRRIRHTPVLENGQLSAMVSIGDLNAYDAGALVATVETLEAYISRA